MSTGRFNTWKRLTANGGGFGVISVDTLAEAQALTGLSEGQQINVASFHTPLYPLAKLHGGGRFTYTENTEEDANGGTVFESDSGGRLIRQYADLMVSYFGVVGDYDTDDTDNLIAAYTYGALAGETLNFEDGVYRVTRSLNLPTELTEAVRWKGTTAGYFSTQDNNVGNKPLLRPGYKHTMSGCQIIFSGDISDYDTYTTSRGDQYSSFTYGLAGTSVLGFRFTDIAFVMDVDVYDAAGDLTSPANDNRLPLDVGVLSRSLYAETHSCNIFGYWNLAGRVIHSQESLSPADSDYNRDFNTWHTSISIIAGDDSDPDNGLTGYFSSGCMFHNAADHHDRGAGDYTRRCIYVDGNNGSFGSRAHRFDGSLRTYANIAIELDHCMLSEFCFAATETPPLSGVTGADDQAQIIGTANTGIIHWTVTGRSHVGQFRLDELSEQITGPILAFGDNSGDFITIYKDGGCIRQGIRDGAPFLQLTDNASTSDSGWTMFRSGTSGTLTFRYDDTARFFLRENGEIGLPGPISGDVNFVDQVQIENILTTSQAANMYATSSGNLRRSTSASKYKKDIKPLTDEDLDKFLQLDGISYLSLCETDDEKQRFTGIVADQAHDLGLTDLVHYSESGEIEGFAYERATAYLLEIVKRRLL